MRNTVLCLKWGRKYSAKYVNILYHSVKRNLSLDYDFVCLTDNKQGLDEGIKTFDLIDIPVPKEGKNSSWRRLALFSPEIASACGIKGRVLYIDLDVIIKGSLNGIFLQPAGFLVARRKGDSADISVCRFEVGSQERVWRRYVQNPEDAARLYVDERNFISETVKDKQFIPDGWCVRFKSLIPLLPWMQPKQPMSARMVLFEGSPMPHEAVSGRWGGRQRKSVDWVATHWCAQGG